MPGIDPDVFDFIAQIASEVNENPDGADGAMSSDSAIITFGEAFFDQFFGSLGHNILGFSTASKRRAIRYVEGLSSSGRPDVEVARIVVAFEEFCDLAADAQGNYSGSVSAYPKALALVDRLLAAAEDWARQLPEDDAKASLLTAIEQARTEIEAVT